MDTTTRLARYARSLALLACLGTFAAGPALLWAQNPSQPVPPGKQPQLPTTKPVDPTPATPSRGKSREGKSEETSSAAADREFAMKAAEGGLLEVELGRLAVQKAESTDVKNFAQRMIDDHSKANDELRTIASDKNIAWPDEAQAKDKHKATLARLEALSGAAFDKAYITDMVKDHVEDVALFDREASQGKDKDLQAFARKTLPTLRDHLTMVREVEQKLRTKGTY